jgi:hypothetical protein
MGQPIDLSTNAAGNLEARLNRHPELKDKIMALLLVVEKVVPLCKGCRKIERLCSLTSCNPP